MSTLNTIAFNFKHLTHVASRCCSISIQTYYVICLVQMYFILIWFESNCGFDISLIGPLDALKR